MNRYGYLFNKTCYEMTSSVSNRMNRFKTEVSYAHYYDHFMRENHNVTTLKFQSLNSVKPVQTIWDDSHLDSDGDFIIEDDYNDD